MAKQFQFRLERVQRLREHVRDRRRLLLGEALQFQLRIENQIQQLEGVRDGELEGLRSSLAKTELDVDKAVQSRLFDGRLINYRRQLERQLVQIQQVVAARRAELLQAERGVQVLEKLGEKQKTRFDEDLAKADLRAMDELAARAAQRQGELDRFRG